MFEWLMLFNIFAGGAGIFGIWFFRKKMGVPFCEKWVRILFSFQLIPALIFLYRLDAELPIKGVFLISWIGFIIWLWKTPIFCTYCFKIVVRGLLISKHCPNCGKEL